MIEAYCVLFRGAKPSQVFYIVVFIGIIGLLALVLFSRASIACRVGELRAQGSSSDSTEIAVGDPFIVTFIFQCIREVLAHTYSL